MLALEAGALGIAGSNPAPCTKWASGGMVDALGLSPSEGIVSHAGSSPA